MNIEEAKKFARNKIETDSLTQQVRDVIKITKWQKQDMREGFKETFKPLIKSQDDLQKLFVILQKNLFCLRTLSTNAFLSHNRYGYANLVTIM